ncbi:MAG: T9SS type B sorting domain-containing protein [Saonia sp.]
MDPNKSINDYEYAITDSIARPFGSWLNPIDHTTNTRATNGRYLVINIGAPDPGQIIYKKVINDIIPNQPLEVSLWAINLQRSGTGGVNPNLRIELRIPGTSTVVVDETTGNIPENDIWNQPPTIVLNPGTNTTLDLVIVTEESQISGNDVAIDDILVTQTPEVCVLSIDTPIVIEAGKDFTANFISAVNASCNGTSDGTITFEVENFDAATGFEYSVDGGTSWTGSTTSPVTTTAVFDAGSHTIDIRRANETTCTTSVTHTITEPNPLVASASITTALTCTNGGATITASATEGTPAYQYQLEDTGGTPIPGYDFAANGTNNVFTGIADGDYIVRVRDANLCEDVIDTPINIPTTDPIVFTVCYSGDTANRTIQVDVTGGNGTYQFQIDGNPWVDPNTNPTRHIFNGLTTGTYMINVRDGLGCVGTAIPVGYLSVDIDVVDISSCADGSITVNATGDTGALEYAFVPTTTDPTGLFGMTSTFAVTTGNDGDYDVYVRDNSINSPFCGYMETVTVDPATPLAFTATPTDPVCYNGTGSIEVDITAGDSPYTIQIVDLDNGGASDETNTNVVTVPRSYFNLAPGNYTINVTDANGCVRTETPVTITNPDELTATIVGITPSTCTGDPNDFGFQFTGYPGTLGTIEFSDDGGTTWIGNSTLTDIFTGYVSGSTVTPAMRTTDGSGNTVCLTVLPEFIIPFPLDDLDITILPIVVNCNELRVSVQGSQGTDPYNYTWSDDPANFDPLSPANPWTTPAKGLADPHQFVGLVPGRTYTFYVRDAVGCIRQSNTNVNDIITVPLEITSSYEPTCDGLSTGSITYTVTDTQAPFGTEFRWEVFDMSSGSALSVADSGGNLPYTSPQNVSVPGLPAGNYFIQVTEVDGGVGSCVGATENLLLEELNPITGTPAVTRDITCASPGLVEIQSIFGGGGTYTYTLSSANFTTDIVSTDNPVEVPIGNLVDATITPFNIAVNVTDQYGCTDPLGSVSITVSQSPTIASIVVDNCISPLSITVNAANGTAPYFYSNDGGVTYVDNGGVFNNVAAGSYSIAVMDSNGCSVVSPTATEVYPILEASAMQTKLLDCQASPNAEITIRATAGSGSYDYEIDGPGASDQSRTTLPVPANEEVWNLADVSGTYTVRVYDNNTPTCPPRSFTVEVPNRIDPVLNIDTVVNETCAVSDDGSITVSATNNGISPFTFQITAVDGGVLTTPIDSDATLNTATTATFTGLTGTLTGTEYTITGTANNGCTLTIDQLITEPQPMVVNAITPVPYGCAAGNNPDNASLTFAGATGGSTNYVRYEFLRDGNPTPVQDGTDPTYIETDFAGGNYVINVYDDKGCVGTTTATIVPFDELQSVTAVLIGSPMCSGENIRIDVVSSLTNSTADLSNYRFRELPSGTFGTSNLFNNLSVGVHVFEVMNFTTGCIINVTHEVSEPNTFDIVINKISDVVCHGTDSGSITLELTDATNNYVGPFDWEIFNTNGTADILDDTSVIGPNTSPDNGPTAPIALFAGTYRVRVTQNNAPACFKDEIFTITTPQDPITATVNQVANVTCTGDQGRILVDPEGGVGPYTINIDSGTQSFTETNVSAYIFEGLYEGTFEVTITDALGCDNTAYSQVLVRPAPITAGISTSYTLDCEGDNDGVVTATVLSGGTGTIQYLLNVYDDAGTTIVSTSVPQASNVFTDLFAGTYSVTIVDEGNCGDTFGPTTISDPSEVNALLVRTSPLTCLTDAALELRASGGTGPYFWSLDDTGLNLNPFDNATTHPFTNVGAGTYSYYVYDSNGCISVRSNEISEDPIINLSLDVDTSAAFINCTGDNTAIIYANADGGLGNYIYELYNNYTGSLANLNALDPSVLNIADRIAVTGPIGTGQFPGLTAGTYYVNVISEDCTAPPQQVVITEPIPLAFTEDFTNETCMGANDGTITITLSGGTGDYQYAISPNLDQFDAINVFSDLAAGNYTVIAQDANGCFVQREYTIEPATQIMVTDVSTPEICAGDEDGTISLTITGGVAPYSTALNSNSDADFIQDQTDFSSLAAGTYVIFIRDANGCQVNTTIVVDGGVNLNANVTPVYECTGDTPNNFVNITLEDDSVLGDVMYALNSMDSADMQLTPDFRNMPAGQHYIAIASITSGCVRRFDFEIEDFAPLELVLEQRNINEITATATGGLEAYTFSFGDVNNGDDNTFIINRTDTYTVTVTDENGCETSADIFIEFIDIEIPNFFTPDGDGLNDVWIPRNREAFPEILTIIFDRYGREIYRMGLNDSGWNGIYQSSELPTGDYWYIIKLNGETDTREFVGHFTLYR